MVHQDQVQQTLRLMASESPLSTNPSSLRFIFLAWRFPSSKRPCLATNPSRRIPNHLKKKFNRHSCDVVPDWSSCSCLWDQAIARKGRAKEIAGRKSALALTTVLLRLRVLGCSRDFAATAAVLALARCFSFLPLLEASRGPRVLGPASCVILLKFSSES